MYRSYSFARQSGDGSVAEGFSAQPPRLCMNKLGLGVGAQKGKDSLSFLGSVHCTAFLMLVVENTSTVTRLPAVAISGTLRGAFRGN